MSDVSSLSPHLRRVQEELPDELQHRSVLTLLQLCVAEDVSRDGEWAPGVSDPVQNDVTSVSTLDDDTPLEGRLLAKEDGIVAGLPLARALFQLVDARLSLSARVEDGTAVTEGETVAVVEGPGPSLLTAERPALNLVGHLSGIATLTRRFVDKIAHTDADILDTRKTAPGARRPNKYAVRQGGGRNHRMGLFDMVLVKDNHIDGAGGITEAIRRVRHQYRDEYPIEVEVKTLQELNEALDCAPDVILLDNMSPTILRTAVDRVEGAVPLEASGNVTLDSVASVAETGVDRISVGAITHSAPTLDLSIRTD